MERRKGINPARYKQSAERDHAIFAALSVTVILGLGAFVGIAAYRVYLIMNGVVL